MTTAMCKACRAYQSTPSWARNIGGLIAGLWIGGVLHF